MLSVLLLWFFSCQIGTPSQETSTSSRYRKANFVNSKFIENKVYQICLPKSYSTNPNEKYPVLYMMDGQNLFFDSLAYIGYAWNIQNVLDSLVEKGITKEVIIVGVENAEAKRFSEYMPQKAVEALPQSGQDSLVAFVKYPIFSDKFLQFLTQELKPHIDKNYRTLSDVSNTFVGGSSMGGLISMYAQCEYPNVFGGAMCISTHWPVALDDTSPQIPRALVNYFYENLPQNKLWYFDYGTVGLDQYYERYQVQIDSILLKNEYVEKQTFLSKKFIGHNHNERYWRNRLHIPLTFMLKKEE